MTVNRSKPDQYQLRFPPGMRDKLKRAADSTGRSMNAEIIDRLEQSFRGWPRISVPEELFARVRKAGTHQRLELEKNITDLVLDMIAKALPTSGALHRDLLTLFHQLVQKAPEDKQEELKAQFDALWTNLSTETDDRRKP